MWKSNALLFVMVRKQSMATPEERKKNEAEQYLEENRIRWMLEKVTCDLIRFTPTKPLKFIRDRIVDIHEDKGDVVRPRIITVIGGPASGKGVTCAHLSQELGTTIIAVSELLRNEIKEGTEVGKRVGEMLHSNTVVPKEIICQLIKQRIESALQSKANTAFVLDGFPRTLDQALHFDSTVCEIAKVIYLDVSENTMKARMDERNTSAQLADDIEPERSKKIKYFNWETIPVIEYYRAMGRVTTLDAEESRDKMNAAAEKAACQ